MVQQQSANLPIIIMHYRKPPRTVRSYLSKESTIALIHALITCRLDNGNALLYGLPKYQIQRLQSVQNCSARLVNRRPKFGHTSPLPFELHWSPVGHRVVLRSYRWFLHL